MTTRLTRIVAPIEPLLSVRDAMEQCRVTDISEQPLLTSYVSAATAYLEAKTGVLGEALVTQTWRLSFDQGPSGSIALPLGPVQSIVIIKYVDIAGAEQTYSSANYRISGQIVELVTGAAWPVVQSREIAFWVDFVAGYGSANQVPETIRQTARFMVAEMYASREVGSKTAMSEAFKYMLAASRSDRGLF